MNCPYCLAECPEGGGACGTCGVPFPFDAASDPLVLAGGTKLNGGTYAIESCLGRGGFGITYRAADLALRRTVAIKEFFPMGCVRNWTTAVPTGTWTPSGFGDGCRQFLEEGRALAQFNHQGIVRVHGAFEENGTAYIVMEFIEGVTFEGVLAERGRLDEAEALPFLVALCEALDEVHAAGLLHRDIKPANVMLVNSRPRGRDGSTPRGAPRVVLIDFGAAREFVAGMSQSHTVVLTPGYAPLEQYTRVGQRGPSVDVYSTCALFYHLLTGTVPPDAAARVQGVALPAIRHLNPTISPTMAEAITRGLEIRTSDRPQGMADLLGLLSGNTLSSAAPAMPPASPPQCSSGTTLPTSPGARCSPGPAPSAAKPSSPVARPAHAPPAPSPAPHAGASPLPPTVKQPTSRIRPHVPAATKPVLSPADEAAERSRLMLRWNLTYWPALFLVWFVYTYLFGVVYADPTQVPLWLSVGAAAVFGLGVAGLAAVFPFAMPYEDAGLYDRERAQVLDWETLPIDQLREKAAWAHGTGLPRFPAVVVCILIGGAAGRMLMESTPWIGMSLGAQCGAIFSWGVMSARRFGPPPP